MMRKTIQRTFTKSTINACKLTVVDGAPSVETLAPVTVTGNVNEKQAMKVLKDEYGKQTAITVTSIDVSEDTYEISVDDFLKYATKIEKGSEGSETVSESSEKATN